MLAEVETIGLPNLFKSYKQKLSFGTLKPIELLLLDTYFEILTGLLKIKVVGDFLDIDFNFFRFEISTYSPTISKLEARHINGFE